MSEDEDLSSASDARDGTGEDGTGLDKSVDSIDTLFGLEEGDEAMSVELDSTAATIGSVG